MHISDYRQIVCDKIRSLFESTFTESDGPEEAMLIGKLVQELMATAAPQELFGFVTCDEAQLVGCIFLTPMTFDVGVSAFLLAPVAVKTEFQGRGIGQQLIRHGLSQMQKQGVELVITYGDPNYYSKVGFVPITESFAKAPYPLSQPQGWQCLVLSGDELPTALGNGHCVSAFNNPAYW